MCKKKKKRKMYKKLKNKIKNKFFLLLSNAVAIRKFNLKKKRN